MSASTISDVSELHCPWLSDSQVIYPCLLETFGSFLRQVVSEPGYPLRLKTMAVIYNLFEEHTVKETSFVDWNLPPIYNEYINDEEVKENFFDWCSPLNYGEHGITIASKVAPIPRKENELNMVDTPGHANFGCEVERVVGIVKGAILVVDAGEGPLAQTKFVLARALKYGLHPILLLNKVDCPAVFEERYTFCMPRTLFQTEIIRGCFVAQNDNQVFEFNSKHLLLEQHLFSSQRVDWSFPPIYDDYSDDGYLVISTKEVFPIKFIQEITSSNTTQGSLEPTVFQPLPIKEGNSWLEDGFNGLDVVDCTILQIWFGAVCDDFSFALLKISLAQVVNTQVFGEPKQLTPWTGRKPKFKSRLKRCKLEEFFLTRGE